MKNDWLITIVKVMTKIAIPERILKISTDTRSKLLKLSSEDTKTWDLLAQRESVTLYKKRLNPDDALDCTRAITQLNKPIDKLKYYLFLSSVIN